ncbi:LolA family protein [Mangrovimonas futianensis]|uniref:LolA family protein n=2 Tax=Mangrovimonas futianensis TaxID=2895523 RepID=UPI001E5806E0|nr:outer membrane lipoprotein carrier protein LolA [Mangrovimonas futianensis]MCF1194049.1 outer membrane lipoprotein carrier protein LolA [Mangrovimonas futianensis]
MRNLYFLFFFMMFSVYGQTKMSSSQAEALRNLVKEQAETTKTIKSDFIQYKHLDFLSNDIITKGELRFKSPNLVKWAYTEPFEYSVIFKNETLFVDDEGKKSQVDLGSNKMFKQLNQLIIKSVKGDMFDEQEFNIAYYALPHGSEVHFSPKDSKLLEYISSFQIIFSAKGDVEQVKMLEPSGDYTKIEFKQRTLNSRLDDAIFNP